MSGIAGIYGSVGIVRGYINIEAYLRLMNIQCVQSS